MSQNEATTVRPPPEDRCSRCDSILVLGQCGCDPTERAQRHLDDLIAAVEAMNDTERESFSNKNLARGRRAGIYVL